MAKFNWYKKRHDNQQSYTVGREQHIAKQPIIDPQTAAIAAINDIIIRHSDSASN